MSVKGRFAVTLSTRGGNQSWSGLVKRFSSERCDWLFVLVGDGRRWFIPADVVEGGSGLLLGGPKYAAYEVGPGRPLTRSPPDRYTRDRLAGFPSGQRGRAVNRWHAFEGSNPSPAMSPFGALSQ